MSFRIKPTNKNTFELLDQRNNNISAFKFSHLNDYDKIESWFGSMYEALKPHPHLYQKWQKDVVQPILNSLSKNEKYEQAHAYNKQGDGYMFISNALYSCDNHANWEARNRFITRSCKLLREFVISTFDQTNTLCKGLPVWHERPL